METSNEELKSSNEELQSTNEELQSANEELETSKEELQSLNEELVTVNAELHGKIDELAQANDDMKNLLDSTKIATVFLDNQLCIKRFTSEATRIINLVQSDVGRPVSHIASKLEDDTLSTDAQQVLDSLVPKQRQVKSREGALVLISGDALPDAGSLDRRRGAYLYGHYRTQACLIGEHGERSRLGDRRNCARAVGGA